MEPLMTHSFGHDLFAKGDHALVGFVTRRWYKATVNESETITDAKTLSGGPLAAAFAILGRS
jgi:hypothetical protein